MFQFQQVRLKGLAGNKPLIMHVEFQFQQVRLKAGNDTDSFDMTM